MGCAELIDPVLVVLGAVYAICVPLNTNDFSCFGRIHLGHAVEAIQEDGRGTDVKLVDRKVLFLKSAV